VELRRGGPTKKPEILALRAKQMRNIMGTLMMSQGTPMISHGDEIGRTQKGNNNVYCQDSELSWMDWSLCEKNADLLAFTPQGRPAAQESSGVPQAAVLRGRADPQRRPGPRHRLADPCRGRDDPRRLGFGFPVCGGVPHGEAIPTSDERGERVVDDSFLLCFNAHSKPVDFVMPDEEYAAEWTG